MEPDQSSSKPRKVKFPPKKPPFRRRRDPQPEPEPEPEPETEPELPASRIILKNEAVHNQTQQSHERRITRGSKMETKFPAEKTTDVSKKKKYREPWDYNTIYPVSLPLREPHSGDPRVLDKEEFEDNPREICEESSVSVASELGLLGQDDTPRMIFLQFPSKLPFGITDVNSVKNQKGKGIAGSGGVESAGTKGKAVAGSSKNGTSGCGSLEDLPEGRIGKMLVYKSGAVKLKIGDILYDVSSGIQVNMPQSVMAINKETGVCCELGEVSMKAVVTPDIDSLLEADVNPANDSLPSYM